MVRSKWLEGTLISKQPGTEFDKYSHVIKTNPVILWPLYLFLFKGV